MWLLIEKPIIGEPRHRLFVDKSSAMSYMRGLGHTVTRNKKSKKKDAFLVSTPSILGGGWVSETTYECELEYLIPHK